MMVPYNRIPSLRKRVTNPFVEMNTLKAKELGIEDGERIVVETLHGGITLKDKLTDAIPHHVL